MTNGTSTDTASRDEAALVALGRSVVYGYLALGFAYPGKALPLQAPEGSSLAVGPIEKALRDMQDAARAAQLGALQRSYMRVFDPRRPPLPLEAELRNDAAPQRAFLLADIMGFYRAFGMAPRHERPDHIACELEFLSVLGIKEALALQRGRLQEAHITADARGKFLREHLCCWSEALLRLVRRRAAERHDRFYLALADAFETTLREEEEALS